MALSVIKYPQGRILDSTATPADVSSSSGALFTRTSHGLVTGDYIYIYGNLAAYNGFWYVTIADANTFRIYEYSGATVQAFINSGTVYFYKSVLTHGWNSVHLPMVYKLQSTVWPVNGVDTARTITTFSNQNGYTYIVASGDIKSSGTASALEEVVLSGTSVDGVYKIINWYSDTNFVINLPYSAGNVLSSGTVQYYYLNYHAKIKIYAGLISSHYWYLRKPFEEVAELKCIPDSSGVITVNVADFVKKKIEILKNDLQQDELPNDIDSWCRVYISYAESYDDSDMYTVSEYVSSYTEDQTEVYAVNAKPQFKFRGSGNMNDWVSGLTSTTPQEFLTPFARPTLFAGKYFDISYIVNSASPNLYMKRDLYSKTDGNYVLISSNMDILPDMDQGVYRYRVTQSASLEDRIDLTLYNYYASVAMSETKTFDVNSSSDCYATTALYLTWKNYLGGQDYWSFTAQKKYSIDIEVSKTQDENIYNNWPNSYGEFGSTIKKQTERRSRNIINVTSQYTTKANIDAISLIKTSPLVQILSSETIGGVIVPILRTVLVDTSTLRKYADRANLYSISFDITYTDEIAVQSL